MGKVMEEFIGTSKVTQDGVILTIVSLSDERRGGECDYIIECSKCSRDEELWPYGSIKQRKRYFLGDILSCGCSPATRWKSWQYAIMIKRECIKRGYTLIDDEGVRYIGKTKLNLKDNKSGIKWNTTDVNNFLQGKCGKELGLIKSSASRLIPHARYIEDFKSTGKFPNGAVFTKNNERASNIGRRYYWDVYCPVCSNDEYVQAGVCDGIFTSHVTSLKNGNLPCRCTNKYKWSEAQMLYKLQKICNEEGLLLKGFVGKWESGSNTKISWACQEEHLCETQVGHFLYRGDRCGECSDGGNGNGYYASRSQEKDYLYILDFGSRYVKVGRSFMISERLKNLRSVSGIKNISVLRVFTASHQSVYSIEQSIHRELAEKGFYHYQSDWSTETFTSTCLESLDKILDDLGMEETIYY